MRAQLITAPASELVTLAEARAHLRLESDLDDDYLRTLITAARGHLEEYCWRGIVKQTWELVGDCFADDGKGLVLPKGNLVSITSVTYVDADGTEQVLAGTNYEKDDLVAPGRLRLAYGCTWPSVRSQWNAVRVRYVVGWEVEAMPVQFKQAALLLISQMYEHRTPEVTGTIISAVGFAWEALVAPYRLMRFD